MVSFRAKNPNLGKFWRVLQWEMLVNFMAIWLIFSPNFGTFYPFWYVVPRKIWQPWFGDKATVRPYPHSSECAVQNPILTAKLCSGTGKARPKLARFRKLQNDVSVNKRPRDGCYDFFNIFAEKFNEKIGVFDSKQS
jgi:hypothetical protein